MRHHLDLPPLGMLIAASLPCLGGVSFTLNGAVWSGLAVATS